MAATMIAMNMDSLYQDLMSLCSMDDTFYYKDIRFQSINYRIFNYRLCSYAAFQSRPAALNCRGTMFNIMDPKKIQLVSLAPEKFFNYEEGFGRKQYHQRGQFGDKMEKMDGTLISTFLHGPVSKERALRLKSKQSLTSKQVLDCTQLLVDEFKTEMEQLVRLNYTVNMEYTSPSNHVFVSYSEAKLSILCIRSHADGHTLFGSRLKTFFVEQNFPTLLAHLVPCELVASDVTHRQLLQEIDQQPYGEGYVVEIIQPDQSSYLIKIKTRKYLRMHRDGDDASSARSLFEAIINEEIDDLRGLFSDDTETLKKIDEMERYVRPKYNSMVESIERFHYKNKHLTKRNFVRLIKETKNMEFYSPLLVKLYDGEEIDYKAFAMKNSKELFDMDGDGSQLTTTMDRDETE